jgi:hypothetical protein
MHVPTIVSILALAAAAVNAVPNAVIADGGVVEKRQVNNIIQLFDKTCFRDIIVQGNAPLGSCRNIPRHAINKANSGKARQGFRCTIYDNGNCQGSTYTLIGNDPKFCRFGNKAGSWRCIED